MPETSLKIVIYPHPALQYASKPVVRINAKLKRIVARMFELMYEAKGIGLAANQVNLPLRLFVMNSAGKPGEGVERVFINPVLSQPSGMEEAEEGCLSLPELLADVRRPAKITMSAFDTEGNEIHERLSGLEARIVQHETDHLDGVLFIDRLSASGKIEVQEPLRDFMDEYMRHIREGTVASDEEIRARLAEWEQEYC